MNRPDKEACLMSSELFSAKKGEILFSNISPYFFAIVETLLGGILFRDKIQPAQFVVDGD